MICPYCCESVDDKPGNSGCPQCLAEQSPEALLQELKGTPEREWPIIVQSYLDAAESRGIEWTAHIAGELYRETVDGPEADEASRKFRAMVKERTREEIV